MFSLLTVLAVHNEVRTMNVMREPYARESVYQDLTDYKLKGTQYRWKFAVTPMGGNFFLIKPSLKKKGLFYPSVVKAEVVVDTQRDDVIAIVKQSLRTMLKTERAQEFLSASK